ncbi:MAG: uroporphyrinogen decarboxylase family protein [Armatimonadota bacterium]
MTQLTDGERIVRCFLGEPVDRVPFGVGIGWVPWGDAMDHWRRDSGDPALDLRKRFGFDYDFIHPRLAYGIFPAFERQVLEENDEFIVWRNELGITKRDRRDGASMPEFLDYPVKTPEDWERLKAERLRIDEPGRVQQDWDAFRSLARETGGAVQLGGFPYGVFGTPRDLMGDEELLVAFYEEPAMVRDMMQHLTGLWISLYERVAAEVPIDHIHIWEDMSGRQGSLISPAMVEEFMMPCYDRIADFARANDIRLLSVDTDGQCDELVPIMAKHGVNMFLPFEVQAGNDILEYRKQYPTLGIWGGLDKRALADSKAAVDEEIARAEAMLKLGRYVPGFDHLIPPDAKWELFEYAAERIKALCYSVTV